MPNFNKNIIFILGLLQCTTFHSYSQGFGTAAGGSKIEIMHGDSGVFSQVNNVDIRKVVGNVKMRHQGALMYCDLAVLNVNTNVIEAFGRVKIIQNDTITVTGDTLYYYGESRLAIMSGKSVVLRDKKRTLTTTKMEYDMLSGVAYYPNKGKTVDKDNVLTSKQGYYNTQTKVFRYYQNVKLISPKYTLTNDTLVYNALTKVADFEGPTKLVGKDGIINTRRGSYNTETGVSIFRSRTPVEGETYTLVGDSLYYDNTTKRGFARGNVEIKSKADNGVLNGEFGQYDGGIGYSKVWGNPTAKSISKAKDTLFMTADTLYSIDLKDAVKDSLAAKKGGVKRDVKSENASKKGLKQPAGNQDDNNKPRKMIGYKNVVVYRKDFQNRCDSMVYNTQDSTIRFFKKPIIWSTAYQMEADSIVAQLAYNKIKTMYLSTKAFIISEDSLKQFNQVKGRKVTAFFDDSTQIQRIFVDGNGQSIYFIVDEKRNTVGMNQVECAKMTLFFEKALMKRIKFVGQPDGSLVPPKEIKADQRQLDGFNWREAEKPTKKHALRQEKYQPAAPSKRPTEKIALPTAKKNKIGVK